MRLVIAAALGSIAALTAVHSACGQSLAERVSRADGTIDVVYPSRAGACGDGSSYLSVFGGSRYTVGDSRYGSRPPCLAGPARVTATVIAGEVTRIRAYVGPVPQHVNAISVSAAEAHAWLAGLIASARDRVAADAVMPLLLVDAQDAAPLLLDVSRSDARPLTVRRSALLWLGNLVTHHLALDDAAPESDQDEMERQAVFVLSQRSRNGDMPELMDVARTAKSPVARREAIFWLGQSGKPAAVADLYAQLLKRS